MMLGYDCKCMQVWAALPLIQLKYSDCKSQDIAGVLTKAKTNP